jgi:glycosyltransferase involved in cell wall biosynthesis
VSIKFSLITPTHKNTDYIIELYDSIKNQTYSNWEWVIWINGSASLDHLSFLKYDERVKIYTDNSKNENVGYHKNKAFSLGVGDVLVEVDHDDILLENCLQVLSEKYEKNNDVGFVFSDNAKFHHEDKFIPYSSDNGWKHYKFKFREKELWVPRSFQPTSHSLSFIWYSPDHVRSWRKSIYKKIGGHDPNLHVLDDQDLMIKTYLETKFLHVNEPLYVYRIYGKNTWLERSAEIQKNTLQMRNKWAQKLAERDAQIKGLKMIDIGGGIDGRPGYTTIDQQDGEIKCDLNEGIPMEDNSCYVVNASHVIEHLKDPIRTMSEIHRVLAHGGWAFIEVPSTDGRGAFQDPTHVSFWNQNSFWYYTRRNQARYIRNTKTRFQNYRLETGYPSKWWKDNNIPVVYAYLVALKDENGQRFPGLVEI